jgi:hypothetical protein
MRNFMTFALLAGPAFAEGPEFPLLAATYELLAEHQNCNELGDIAFRIETTQTIQVGFYPAELTDADAILAAQRFCTIKTRKGGITFEDIIPCEDADEMELGRLARETAFCEANRKLPRDSTLHLEATACLSLGRFEVLEGRWTLGSETEFGPYSLAYDMDAGQIGLNYIAAMKDAPPDSYAVVETGGKSTPARIRMQMYPSGNITLRDLPGVELRVASEVDIYLFDSGRANCLQDPTKCLAVRAPWHLYEITNPVLLPLLSYSSVSDLGAQPAPAAAKYMVRCNER